MGGNVSASMWRAAKRGDAVALDEALRRGADCNYCRKGLSALAVAARRGNYSAVTRLLGAGAVDRPAPRTGNTALHLAAWYGNPRVVELLMARGSSHWAVNKKRRKPIDEAARVGHTEVVRLIEAKMCPFRAAMYVRTNGMLNKWKRRWCVVARVMPRDAPTLDRNHCVLSVYKSQADPRASIVIDMMQATVVVVQGPDLGTQATHDEVVTLLIEAKGKMHRFRCGGATYNWLLEVLNTSSFVSGTGTLFNSDGSVAAPTAAQQGLGFTLNGSGRVALPRARGGPGGVDSSGWLVSSSLVSLPGAVEAGAPAAGQPSGARAVVPPPDDVVVGVPVAVGTPSGGAAAAPAAPGSDRIDYEALGIDVPSFMVGPISFDLLRDPVVAADGHTYERGAIAAWLATNRRSPKTNEVLHDLSLRPNHSLRAQIIEWREGITKELKERKAAEARRKAGAASAARRAAAAAGQSPRARARVVVAPSSSSEEDLASDAESEHPPHHHHAHHHHAHHHGHHHRHGHGHRHHHHNGHGHGHGLRAASGAGAGVGAGAGASSGSRSPHAFRTDGATAAARPAALSGSGRRKLPQLGNPPAVAAPSSARRFGPTYPSTATASGSGAGSVVPPPLAAHRRGSSSRAVVGDGSRPPAAVAVAVAAVPVQGQGAGRGLAAGSGSAALLRALPDAPQHQLAMGAPVGGGGTTPGRSGRASATAVRLDVATDHDVEAVEGRRLVMA